MLNFIAFVRSFLRSTFLIGGLLSLVSGCALTIPAAPEEPENRSTIDDQTVSAEEIWRQLAVAAARGTITKTTQLAQIVLILVKNGDLSEKDASKFDLVFTNFTTIERELTDTDIQSLRSLK